MYTFELQPSIFAGSDLPGVAFIRHDINRQQTNNYSQTRIISTSLSVYRTRVDLYEQQTKYKHVNMTHAEPLSNNIDIRNQK